MRRMRRTAERIHVERNSPKNYVNGAYFGYIGATASVTMTLTLSSHRSGICLLFVCCLSVVCLRALHRKFHPGRHKGGTVCPHAQIQRESSFLNDRIRCVLVHDHVLLRQGLRSLLEGEIGLQVVAEAGNAAEALQRVC